MLQRFRQYGPVLMVPAAWGTTALALHTSILGSREMMIAHFFMSLMMAAFLITGWNKMNEGILKAWRSTIVIGLIITLTGLTGFIGSDTPWMHVVSLYGWMIIPGIALIYTGLKDELYGKKYIFSGSLSLLGFIVYFLQRFNYFQADTYSLSGLILLASGQTLGILVAAYQNSGRE